MNFPIYRPRRLRQNEKLRSLIRETGLEPNNLIYPVFVGPGKDKAQPVSSMPGVAQLSVDRAAKECAEVGSLGIPAVILFGIPEQKDPMGSEAYADNGVVQQAVRAVKEKVPEMVVITDVCLCEYTDHGHCGVLSEYGRRRDVDNDATLPLLAQQCVSHARAGADILTVHVETCPHLHRVVEQIKEVGVKAGVTLNPATPLQAVEYLLGELDLVLCMSVNPGFGGQAFIPAVYPKIRQVRALLGARSIDVSIDGGVKVEHARPLVEHGASILVAGSAVFEADDPATVIKQMRAAADA